MDDFLVKPFDELQIGEMLRRWIPSHEQAPRENTWPRSQGHIAARHEAGDATTPTIPSA